MRALITITHRTVEHNDPVAAGFVDGYWWTLSCPDHDHPDCRYIESASPTAERSEEFARNLARTYGYPDEQIQVVSEGELLKRKGDEARVEKLISANAP